MQNNNAPKTNNYYQDERPLPTLANKNDLKATKRYPQEDNYEDEYAEDFEEYWSDEEEVGGLENRLTLKPTQNDLSDIINLYKEKLNLGNKKNSEYEGIFLFRGKINLFR